MLSVVWLVFLLLIWMTSHTCVHDELSAAAFQDTRQDLFNDNTESNDVVPGSAAADPEAKDNVSNQLPISSISSLCYAQCKARYEATQDFDVQCNQFTTSNWAKDCETEASRCLETCSCPCNETISDHPLPTYPDNISYIQQSAYWIKVIWSASLSKTSVRYVIETSTTTSGEKSWNFLNETTETSVLVWWSKCQTVFFRVAAVNRFGWKGFADPIPRDNWPKPDAVENLTMAVVQKNTTNFDQPIRFAIPYDWLDATLQWSVVKIVTCASSAKAPNPSFFLTQDEYATANNTQLLHVTVPIESGYGCEYIIEVHLLSQCNNKNGEVGPMSNVTVNFTDCHLHFGDDVDCNKVIPEVTVSPSTISSSTTSTTATTTNRPTVKPGEKQPTWVIVITAIGSSAVIIIVVVIILIICRFKRRSKSKRSQSPATSNDSLSTSSIFATTMITNILYDAQKPTTFVDNSEDIDEWEISPDCLQVEQVLGHGAFGEVHKAILTLNSTIPYLGNHDFPVELPNPTAENSTQFVKLTVAVKMLFEHCESYREEFLHEIELMKSIGYHINVVSMIGCCTKANPICLIVEHVPHGDLQSYLREMRPAIADTVSSQAKETISNSQSLMTCCKEILTQKDLLNMATQIATGMEFLSSKCYVHRDLATRNVLVGHNRSCKIGDFGLTRYVYDDQIYITNKGGKLPLKWMAIESIFDLRFTTASDVWSFGVVLFELITFGATPYPTIDNKDLLNELMSGYRMERPPNCSQKLHELMLDCWVADSEARPSFTQLIERIKELMDGDCGLDSLNKLIVDR